MEFTCPQCEAKVTKEKEDPLGCPCCGYAAEGVFPYTPALSCPVWVTPPYLWDPYRPTWVGDEIIPLTITPKITWTDNTSTLITSTLIAYN